MTGYSILDKKPSNKIFLAFCSSRKCKSLIIENVAMQLIEVSNDHSFGEKKFKINGSSLIVNLVKLENSNVFDGFSTKMLKLIQNCCIKIMGLLQRGKLSFSGRRTKVFNLCAQC